MKLSLALQRAILSALRANPPLLTALGGPNIHDAPPHAEEATLPNIVFGDETVIAWSAQDSDGSEHELSFSIWSDAKGFAEVKAAMAALFDALDGAALDLETGHLVSLRFVSARTSREARGRLRRASCRFRALVEHAAPG